jgi:hypothetical protein
MKKIIISFVVVMWLIPYTGFGETLTKKVLKELGFYPETWNYFLKNSQTDKWKQGKIGNSFVKYNIGDDVIAYDSRQKIWWHIMTPLSTTLPIDALALRFGSDGRVTTEGVLLEKVRVIPVKKIKSLHQYITKKRTPHTRGNVEKQLMLKRKKPIKIVSKKSRQLVKKKVAKKILPHVKRKSVTVQKQKVKKLKIASTWQFMDLWLEKTGER